MDAVGHHLRAGVRPSRDQVLVYVGGDLRGVAGKRGRTRRRCGRLFQHELLLRLAHPHRHRRQRLAVNGLGGRRRRRRRGLGRHRRVEVSGPHESALAVVLAPLAGAVPQLVVAAGRAAAARAPAPLERILHRPQSLLSRAAARPASSPPAQTRRRGLFVFVVDGEAAGVHPPQVGIRAAPHRAAAAATAAMLDGAPDELESVARLRREAPAAAAVDIVVPRRRGDDVGSARNRGRRRRRRREGSVVPRAAAAAVDVAGGRGGIYGDGSGGGAEPAGGRRRPFAVPLAAAAAEVGHGEHLHLECLMSHGSTPPRRLRLIPPLLSQDGIICETLESSSMGTAVCPSARPSLLA